MLRNIKTLLLFVVALPTFCFAQNGGANSIAKNIVGYNKAHQEKIYVHTDKQQYFAGEDIWYKIYNLKIDDNKKSEESKIAFLELFNRDKQPVLQAKIKINKGVASSALYLPASLPSGNYLLRSYTTSMQSNATPLFFEKELRILNVKDGLDVAGASSNVKYDFQVFPEGGDIVEGLPTKIAFKLTNSFGAGVDFEGVIVDQEENIVKEIKSLKYGIGSTSFAPMENKRYKAKIYLKDGTIVNKNLPNSLKNGYILNVTRAENNRVRIRVFGSKDLNDKAAQLVVIAKSGLITLDEKITVSASSAQDIFIEEGKLEDGISAITLFDAQKKAVAERLIFKRPEDRVSLAFSNKKDAYQKRNKVEFDLELVSNNDMPSSDLSVAVYKIDTANYSNLNINSYLLLSSELRGKIEGIDYYLEDKDQRTADALDNLMLTHGWRRFKGSELNATIPQDQNARGQLIQGRVKNKSGQPVADVLTYLSVPGGDTRLFVAKTDDKGIASFDVKNYYGAGELVLQTDDAKRSDYDLELLSPFYKGEPVFRLDAVDFAKINGLNYLDNGIAVQVESSFRQKEKNKFSVAELDTLPFYFKADRKFNLEDYTRFRTMEEVLREYVSGAALRKTGDSYQLYLLDANRGYHFDKQPLILFNGVPTFNTSKVIAYDPLKVRSIELVYKRYYYGPLVADGIVNFKTYESGAPELEMDAKALSVSYDGLQPSKEFYTPVYDLPEQVSNRTPDFRTLLHWDPKVSTNKQGKAVLKFYTSDRTGDFKVVVNGVTENGLLVNGSTTIKVN